VKEGEPFLPIPLTPPFTLANLEQQVKEVHERSFGKQKGKLRLTKLEHCGEKAVSVLITTDTAEHIKDKEVISAKWV